MNESMEGSDELVNEGWGGPPFVKHIIRKTRRIKNGQTVTGAIDT